MPIPIILIIGHSTSGGTRSLMEACERGVRRSEAAASVEVKSLTAASASTTDLLLAQAFIFASPENFGYMSGLMKDFFDRSFYPCENALQGRPYTTLICAGNDGRGAESAIDRIVTGWRLRKVFPGLIARRVGGMAGSSRGHLAPGDLEMAEEVGEFFAEGLSSGVF